MKLMKKLSKGILVVVLCMLLVTTAWATEQAIATYSAALDTTTFCVNDLNQAKTVTLTAKVNELVKMDAFTAQVKAPEALNVTGIANEKLNFSEDDFWLETATISWYSKDANAEDNFDVENDLLATVTIEIPAGTPAGQYEIEFEIIDISRDFGMPWEDGQILPTTLTIGAHADGNDADHLCDTCNGAVEGAVCEYKPGEYNWNDDNTACSVVGTCACGNTATANATVTSEVTTVATCQTAEVVTYTATFKEAWADTQTKAITGETNPDNHTYVDGKCACGAEEPGEPVTGLKGDVNLDGQVTLTDAVLAAQYYMDWDTNPITDPVVLYNADFNDDGALSLTDAVEIAKYYMNN